MNLIPSVQWQHTKSALTPILDFFLSSEVATTWQTGSTAHKLKLRSFHKSVHLWAHLADFHPSVNRVWHILIVSLFINNNINISNIPVMVGNFNIRDSFWDPMYSHHSAYSDIFLDITDSLSLGLLYPTNPVPTRFSDNDQNLHSVIDLIFFRYGSVKLDNYTIYLEWRLLSDHTPLTVTIPIEEEYADNCRCSIL